jgi:hypothetical protein
MAVLRRLPALGQMAIDGNVWRDPLAESLDKVY